MPMRAAPFPSRRRKQSLGCRLRTVVAQLLERIEQLECFPQSGRIVPEFQQSELRELIEPPFRLVYRLTSNSLTVIRILRPLGPDPRCCRALRS